MIFVLVTSDTQVSNSRAGHLIDAREFMSKSMGATILWRTWAVGKPCPNLTQRSIEDMDIPGNHCLLVGWATFLIGRALLDAARICQEFVAEICLLKSFTPIRAYRFWNEIQELTAGRLGLIRPWSLSSTHAK